MYKGKREDELLLHLTEVEYATIEALADKMQISPSSIRRDLKDLERRGLVKRSYGGVKITEAARGTLSHRMADTEEGPALPLLCKAAISLITPNTALFLDASVPSLALSRLLPGDMGLTVLTNSPELASLLVGRGITTYCAGGACRAWHPSATVGEAALELIRSMHADIVFLSPDALSPEGILLDSDGERAAIHRQMSRNARRTVVLLEGTRAEAVGTFSIGSCDTVERIITDHIPDGCTIPSEKLLCPTASED